MTQGPRMARQLLPGYVAVGHVRSTWKVAVVFESASPGDGRLTNSWKLGGYGPGLSWFSYQ
jgi:hypothetical protein